MGCSKAKVVVAFDHPNGGTLFPGEALLSFPEDFRRAQFSGNEIKGPSPSLFFYPPKCYCKSHHG
jgi:hypothetical protein